MNTSSVNVCSYCYQPREFSTGWHGCRQSKLAQAKLAGHVQALEAIGRGEHPESLNPERTRDIEQRIKITGGGVKPQN